MYRRQITPVICIILALFSTFTLIAQPPQGITFQGEAREADGKLLTNKTLEVKIRILKEIPGDPPAYEPEWESIHTINTDKYGLFTIIIGTGEPLDPEDKFEDIPWSEYDIFLNVQIDDKGNWLDLGTTQFLSVPYALHAGSVSKIGGLSNPTEPNDAATKEYVDQLMGVMENAGINIVDFTSDVQDVPLRVEVNFEDESKIVPTSWFWEFGDGITASVEDPKHAYEVEGSYTVTLTASNGIITRTMTKPDFVTVYKTVQERLDDGETPFEIYTSDPTLLNELYGKNYQDGLIFYLHTVEGWGLVAYPEDIGTSPWGSNGINIASTMPHVGYGRQNTELIVAGHLSLPNALVAARLCDDISSEPEKKWSLPSSNELGQMYHKLHKNGYGNFANSNYWSSYQGGYYIEYAYYVNFVSGSESRSYKSNSFFVRPVRRFSK